MSVASVTIIRTFLLFQYSQMYMNASKDDHPPHVFAVADQSYQMMMHNRKHQCIVISGESGAGKTESANLLVQQLTQLGKVRPLNFLYFSHSVHLLLLCNSILSFYFREC